MHQNFAQISAVVVFKWSAYSPSTQKVWVRILLRSTIILKIVIEKNQNKQKMVEINTEKICHNKVLQYWLPDISEFYNFGRDRMIKKIPI